MKLLVLTVLCCIALASCVPDAHDNEEAKPASTQNEELLQDAPEVDETSGEMKEDISLVVEDDDENEEDGDDRRRNPNTCLGRPSVFRLCENRQGTLRCPKGKVIVVAYANYGRTAKGVCRHNSIKTTCCYSRKSKILIRKACHGKNKCALNARNSVYGDPCYGTYKYIEVFYHCV
ncbi:L-rhamnose-binding lectin ELEL-1 isoform X3 [Nematostella vectensis]|uniref:L-rhamnose-binding lectin ELEL-1 isoform X3 n=1 Tax=Nematostella vectensis TaxID=45351 RepID=UPI0020774BE2|nr:L-rhamnose-binding lectin ELEL-1 isoform X3 [Nematostella vectensis]